MSERDPVDVELEELRAWKAEVLRRNAVPSRAAADEIERLREENGWLRAIADAARAYQSAEDWYGKLTTRPGPVSRHECEVAATGLRESAAVLRHLLASLDVKGGVK